MFSVEDEDTTAQQPLKWALEVCHAVVRSKRPTKGRERHHALKPLSAAKRLVSKGQILRDMEHGHAVDCASPSSELAHRGLAHTCPNTREDVQDTRAGDVMELDGAEILTHEQRIRGHAANLGKRSACLNLRTTKIDRRHRYNLLIKVNI